MNEEAARKRIAELRGYYGHLAAYGAVNLFLFGLNIFLTPDFYWFFFPLFGWGIGLAIHTVHVFGTGHDWERRKLEELTGLKTTRDELERLSERTDALVTIMASVDWEKIDPNLRDTRRNLEDAQRRIAELRGSDDPASQAEVMREIEKLEAFVTSSRFDYYERAAEDAKPN